MIGGRHQFGACDRIISHAVARIEDHAGRANSASRPDRMARVGSCEQPMNNASQSEPIVARAKSRTSSAVMRPSAAIFGARKEFRRTTLILPLPRNAVSCVLIISEYGVTTAIRCALSCRSALIMARAVVITGSEVASLNCAASSASPAGPDINPAAVQP